MRARLPTYIPIQSRMPAQVGSLFGDFLDGIASAVKGIPGGDWVVTAVSNGADWIGNAAKTPGGLAVLQVITSGLASSLAVVSIPSVSGMQTIGPVISSVVFALPGTVAGKDFVQSYVEEFTARVVTTAAILSANPGLAATLGASLGTVTSVSTSEIISRLDSIKQIQDAFSKQILKVLNDSGFRQEITRLADRLGVNPSRSTIRRALRDNGLTAPQIAKKFGVRPDAAATAVNGGLQAPAYGVGAPNVGESEFDIFGLPNSTYANTERNSGGAMDGELEVTPGEPLGGPLKPALPVRTSSAPILTITPSGTRGVFGQLFNLALATSPLWGVMLYSHLKEKR